MKLFGFFCGLTSVAMGGVVAPGNGYREARVSVTFLHPETYTDAKAAHFSTDRERDGLLRTLGAAMQKSAAESLRSDLRLTIEVKNIDLAGDFQEGRGIPWSEVRVISDLYPPRMVFDYRLSDARGRTLSEGEARLSDSNYLFGMQTASSDSLRYDKALFRDWVRTKLAPYRK